MPLVIDNLERRGTEERRVTTGWLTDVSRDDIRQDLVSSSSQSTWYLLLTVGKLLLNHF